MTGANNSIAHTLVELYKSCPDVNGKNAELELIVVYYYVNNIHRVRMAGESNVKLTISLDDSDLDAEELNKLTRNLLKQIKDSGEVEDANLVTVEEAPERTKAFGGFLLGMLTAEVNPANFKRLLGFIGDRLGNKAIELEVEANGKKLKVKASSQQELLAATEAAEKFVGSA